MTNWFITPTVGEMGAGDPLLLGRLLPASILAATLLAAESVLTMLPAGRLQLTGGRTVRDKSKRRGADGGRTCEACKSLATGALDGLFEGDDRFVTALQPLPRGGQTVLPYEGDSDRRPRCTTFVVTFDSRFKSGHQCAEPECGGGYQSRLSPT